MSRPVLPELWGGFILLMSLQQKSHPQSHRGPTHVILAPGHGIKACIFHGHGWLHTKPFQTCGQTRAGHEPRGRHFQPRSCAEHGAGVPSDTEYGHEGLLVLSIGLAILVLVYGCITWPHTLQGCWARYLGISM